MTHKRIHIVSFDVPFPPDYGGVLDVYLRCKTLKDLGYYVVLHAYEYGRGRTHPFSDVADEVHYYDRSTSSFEFFRFTPYIIQSRRSKKLLTALLADNDPILLEGQHNSYWLNRLATNNRVVAIRTHNIEWQYYKNLERATIHPLKKLFFGLESKKLRAQEHEMRKVPLCCISLSDTNYYRELGFEAYYLPVSLHPDLILPEKPAAGFALFHGNLSVAENIRVIEELFAENKRHPFQLPIVIAGKNPSKKLQKAIENEGWKCVANPTSETLDELLSTCLVHLLIAQQTAGIKLKALRALMSGKRCVATLEMVENTGLEAHCEVWNRSIPLAQFIEQQHIEEVPDASERHRILLFEHGPERLQEVLQQIGIEATHYF